MANTNDFEIVLGAQIDEQSFKYEFNKIKSQLQSGDDANIKIKTDVEYDKNTFVKLKNIFDKLSSDNPTIKIDDSQVKQASDSAIKLREELKKINTVADESVKKLGENLISGVLQQLRTVLNECVESVREFDEAIFNLQTVTGGTREEAGQLLNTYNQMAQALGSTTTAVAESANEFLRQGLSQADTNKMITASQYLAKLGLIDNAEATQYLTSATKGYKLGAEEAMGVVDKLTAVDLHAAVSSGYLASAMSRTSNSASEAGVSVDTLISYIATIGETTQRSAETVGESLKTMLARYSNVKIGNFAAMGEDMENLNDIEPVLRSIGIALRDSKSNVRDFDDVLYELAGKWGTLTELERNAVGTAMAQTRQKENFLVLMNNFNSALELEKISLDSAGTATEKYQAYQESLDAALNRLQTTWDNLALSLADSGVFTFFVNLANGALQAVGNIQILIPLLGALGSLLVAKFLPNIIAVVHKFKEFGLYFKNIGTYFKNPIKAMTSMVGAFKNINVAATLAKMQLQGMSQAELMAALQARGYSEKLSEVIAKKVFDINVSKLQEKTINGVTTSVLGETVSLGGLKTAMNELGVTTELTSVAMKGLQAAMLWITIAITAFTILGEVVKGSMPTAQIEEYNTKIEETTSRISDLKTQLENVKQQAEKTASSGVEGAEQQAQRLNEVATAIEKEIQAEEQYQKTLIESKNKLQDIGTIGDHIREKLGEDRNTFVDFFNFIITGIGYIRYQTNAFFNHQEGLSWEEYLEQYGYALDGAITKTVNKLKDGSYELEAAYGNNINIIKTQIEMMQEAIDPDAPAEAQQKMAESYLQTMREIAESVGDFNLIEKIDKALMGDESDRQEVIDYVNGFYNDIIETQKNASTIAETEAGTLLGANAKIAMQEYNGVVLDETEKNVIRAKEILGSLPESVIKDYQEAFQNVSSLNELINTDDWLDIQSLLQSAGFDEAGVNDFAQFIIDNSDRVWDNVTAGATDLADEVESTTDDMVTDFDKVADAISAVFDIPDGLAAIQTAFDEFNTTGKLSEDAWNGLVKALGSEGAIGVVHDLINGTADLNTVQDEYKNKINDAANAAFNGTQQNENLATAEEEVGTNADSATTPVSSLGDETEGAGKKAKLASTHTQSFAFGISNINTNAQSTPGVLSSAKGAISSLGDTAETKTSSLWGFANGLLAIVNAWSAYDKAKSGKTYRAIQKKYNSTTTNNYAWENQAGTRPPASSKPNTATSGWFTNTQVSTDNIPSVDITDYLDFGGGYSSSSGGGGGGGSRGSGGSGGGSSSSKSEDTWKKAFETELADLKHAKEMDYITEKDYYDKLDALNKKYFANRKEYEDEYKKYLEEIYKGRKKLLQDEQKDKENAAKEDYNRQKEALKNQKDALKKQADAYDDLIDKRKELLKTMKDEKSFQDDLAEKNKDIVDIQNQLAELQYDNSAEGKKKRLELEDELAKAMKEKEDFIWENSVDAQEDALDKESDRYNNYIDKLTDKIDTKLDKAEAKYNKTLDNIEKRYEKLIKKLSDDTKTPTTSAGSSSGGGGKHGVVTTGFGLYNLNGTRGADVTWVQQQLNARYGAGLKVDGIWGSGTQRAWIRALQTFLNKNFNAGLKVDGVWGSATQSAWEKAGGGARPFHTGVEAGFVGGLKGNEMFAKLMKGELVITPEQQDKFVNQTLPSMLGKNAFESNVGKGDISFDLDINVAGNLDDKVVPKIESVMKNVVNTYFIKGQKRNVKSFGI
nr:MAG TPA: minor tail protein [Caudoviricetes sp.]